MNPLLAPAVFGGKRDVELRIKQSSIEILERQGKVYTEASWMPPRSRYRL